MDVGTDDDGGGDIPAVVATRAEQSAAAQSTLLDTIARKATMKERLMEKLREEKEVERESVAAANKIINGAVSEITVRLKRC